MLIDGFANEKREEYQLRNTPAKNIHHRFNPSIDYNFLLIPLLVQ
ncbi:hypothetical protein AB48_4370 [Escherichia coli 3-475-03_S1_C2]|nr:hypothetical protein AB48_4370 [Escherichia coli 3-475-03_S1_C2]